MVDTKQYAFNGNCEVYKNTTYATTDFFAKAFGAEIKVDGNRINLVKDDIKIDARVGSGIYIKNEMEKVSAKEAVYKKKGKLFLPLRLVSNLFNYEVLYKEGMNSIVINKNLENHTAKPNKAVSDSVEYKISNNNKWGAWVEQYYDQSKNVNYYTVYLKNLDTDEIQEIYSSEKVIVRQILFWTEDNELLMGAYKDMLSKKDRAHILLYSPITQKSSHLTDIKNGSDFMYIDSKNVLIYKNFKDQNDIDPKYKMFSLDTKKSEDISKETYLKLLDEQLGKNA